MSRIGKAFENGKAFITFITCGDPDLETTKNVVLEAVKNGADLVELGIPFSDPTAEGPVIQAANKRALEGGVTTDKVFSLVEELRRETDVPLLFMTYANVVYSYDFGCPSTGSGTPSTSATLSLLKCSGTLAATEYGALRQTQCTCGYPECEAVEGYATIQTGRSGIHGFLARCRKSGIDGLILPDVPFEEKEEFSTVCDEYGVDLISLIAPTSEDRIMEIAANAKGFIYVVSSLGVTGVRSEITTDIGAMVDLVRKATDVPCAVGFGISTPEQAAQMAEVSDGAIVGSAIMKIIAEHGKESPAEVGKYVKKMAEAVHRKMSHGDGPNVI